MKSLRAHGDEEQQVPAMKHDGRRGHDHRWTDHEDVEIAGLRHQLMVVRRQVARPRYRLQDRLVLAMLSRLVPRERWPVFLVTPVDLAAAASRVGPTCLAHASNPGATGVHTGQILRPMGLEPRTC
jgi:hypothetical protein